MLSKISLDKETSGMLEKKKNTKQAKKTPQTVDQLRLHNMLLKSGTSPPISMMLPVMGRVKCWRTGSVNEVRATQDVSVHKLRLLIMDLSACDR